MSAPRSDNSRPYGADKADKKPAANPDRWIWGLWVAVLLLAAAILPFSARLEGVARAIAVFCGFAV